MLGEFEWTRQQRLGVINAYGYFSFAQASPNCIVAFKHESSNLKRAKHISLTQKKWLMVTSTAPADNAPTSNITMLVDVAHRAPVIEVKWHNW